MRLLAYFCRFFARSGNTPTQEQRETTFFYTFLFPQLYQKIQFKKSLHSSPQLTIQILVFLVVLIAIATRAARLGNTLTQHQRWTTTAYTTPILWGIYLENDLKYANLEDYHDRI
ncbi:hypothetical protein ED562_02255 [Microcystis aeruginosa FACHB-524]|nr:hypothetical protein ED562_02255 [Microcystis aeruginosa FACHB-524]